MKFKDLGLNEQIIEAISYMGFDEATPIQEQTIPQIIKGKDVLAFAQTGTGKTAAFILPVLHKLAEKPVSGINTLVVVPTRELAIQIDRQIQGFVYFIEASSATVYGGGDANDFVDQKNALKEGANIIVATPGKLISHLGLGYVKLDQLKHFILDEADRMLDMGFLDDINKIISYLPKEKQTLLFSATMAKRMDSLTDKLLNDPFKVSLAISKPAAGVKQGAYLAYDPQKTDLLDGILKENEEYQSILVFCSTRKKVFDVVRALRRKRFNVEAISSDLEQKEREDVLQRFRAKKTKILVATDVLSRGIDIKDINLVVNYDVPPDPEDYVHRIGRTARAATKGVALTFVNTDDMHKFQKIEKLIESEVPKIALPEALGEGPVWRAGRPKGKGGFNKSKGKGGKKPWQKGKNFKPRNNQGQKGDQPRGDSNRPRRDNRNDKPNSSDS